jgi:hypothetical protein
MNHNIITPWITFQPIMQSKINNNKEKYEICIFNTMYSWFDWLIYIHMLLAQADMVLIEMITDVVATCVVTRWYINIKTKQISIPLYYEESLI